LPNFFSLAASLLRQALFLCHLAAAQLFHAAQAHPVSQVQAALAVRQARFLAVFGYRSFFAFTFSLKIKSPHLAGSVNYWS
jgi:hypothetical protein